MFKYFTGCSVIYILWLLTTQVTSLRYLTTWTIIVQGLYFISEFHWNNKVPNTMQNMAWSLSIFLIVYWPIKYFFKWAVIPNDLLHDLSIHGINILLVIIACFWKPRLEYKYIWIPMLFGIVYLIFAVIYTIYNGSIYPTNFFVLDWRIWYDLAAVFIGTPIIHTMGVYLTKLRDKCRREEMLPTSMKKIWIQRSLLEYHRA